MRRILLCLMLVSTPVMACESFDNCMKDPRFISTEPKRYISDDYWIEYINRSENGRKEYLDKFGSKNLELLENGEQTSMSIAENGLRFTDKNSIESTLRAIAFKLAEISEKLDKPSDDGTEYYPENSKNPDESKYVKQMCADGCVRWFDEAHSNFWKNGAAGSAISCKRNNK